MTNVLMVGPAGVNQFTGKTGAIYLADSNGVFSLSAYDAIEALRAFSPRIEEPKAEAA